MDCKGIAILQKSNTLHSEFESFPSKTARKSTNCQQKTQQISKKNALSQRFLPKLNFGNLFGS